MIVSLNKITSTKSLVLADHLLLSVGRFIITLLIAGLLDEENLVTYYIIVLYSFMFAGLSNTFNSQAIKASSFKWQIGATYKDFAFYQQIAFTLLSLGFLFLTAFVSGWYQLINGQTFAIVSGILMHNFVRRYLLCHRQLLFLLAIDFAIIIPQILTLLTCYGTKATDAEILSWFGAAYFSSVLVFSFWLKPTLKHLHAWPSMVLKQIRQTSLNSFLIFTMWIGANLIIVLANMFIGIELLIALQLIQSLFCMFNVLFQNLGIYTLPSLNHLYTSRAGVS